MDEQILKIIKEKDSYKHSVEIKENAKGEPSITIKIHSDGSCQEAGDSAIAEYTRIKKELGGSS